jgi:hypothetical protein
MSEIRSQSAQQNCNPPVDDFAVVVVATGGVAGYTFHLEQASGQAPYLQGQTITFRQAGQKKFMMRFILQNRGASPPLKFLTPASEAIWLKEGSGCPTGPFNGKEFNGSHVSNNGAELTLKNENETTLSYSYALRFKTEGGAIEKYDPVIENGGGGANFC